MKCSKFRNYNRRLNTPSYGGYDLKQERRKEIVNIKEIRNVCLNN